jgi:hypothetical protein
MDYSNNRPYISYYLSKNNYNLIEFNFQVKIKNASELSGAFFVGFFQKN